MPRELSTAKFVALLSLRLDLGPPERVPDPLPKARAIVISDWPARNAQLLLRLCRALSGRDEVFSMRDVEGLDLETVSVALALAMAGVNQRYAGGEWSAAVAAMERAVTQPRRRGARPLQRTVKPSAKQSKGNPKCRSRRKSSSTK